MKGIAVLLTMILLTFPNVCGSVIVGPAKDIGSIPADIVGGHKKSNDAPSVIVLDATAFSGLAKSAWPMFHHDLNHTGRSEYSTTKNNGTMRWSFTNWGWVDGSVALDANGTIYYGADDTSHKIFALWPNGTKKWDFTTGGQLMETTPAIDSNGTIYFGTTDKKLYALYPDGTKKWEFLTGDLVLSCPAIDSNGTIYFGSEDGKVYAVYPNGQKKWEFPTGGHISSSPAIAPNGTVYIGSEDGNLYALYPNGQKKWSYSTYFSKVLSSPAIGPDGTIYFGAYGNDHNLTALKPNGVRKWNFLTGDNIDASPAIGADGTIYITSWDKNLYAINPDGSKKWNYTTGDRVGSSPVIGKDGTIFFGSDDKNFYAIYPNGTKRWSFGTGGWVIGSAAISRNGMVYIGSADMKLYAIGIDTPSPPLALQAVGSDRQVDLAWFGPSSNGGAPVTGYTIYRGTSPGCETFLANVGSVFLYQDKGLMNGQQYFYTVTATNLIGEGMMSNEASATPMTFPMAPQGLKGVPGNHTVSLTWTLPSLNGGSPITNFMVYRNGTLLKEIGNVLLFNDTKLDNGVAYTYNITAKNIVGEGPRSVGAVVTPRTVPTAPQNLHASNGIAQVALTWLAPASNGGAAITNYTIYRATKSGCETLLVKGYAGKTSWNDTTVSAGMKYYYMVSAVNVAGEGAKSAEASSTPYSLPDAPYLYLKGGISNVTLTWAVPNSIGTPIVNYSIYRGTAAGAETLLVKGHTGGTLYVDRDITEGTLYYYMVAAVNAGGEGARSNELSATPYGVPDAPNLTAAPGNLMITLSWTLPNSHGSDITGYNIYRGTAPGDETLDVDDFNGATHWVDKDAPKGIMYYYRVSAVNAAGEGSKSKEQTAKSYTVPSAPVLTSTAGDMRILLTWTAPSPNGAPILNYRIYRGTTASGGAVLVGNYTGGIAWTDTNITPGTTYYYQVSAVNVAGEGPRSNQQSHTAGAAPGMPTALTASSGAGQVVLKWSEPTGGGKPNRYNVYRSDSQTGTYLLVSSPMTTNYKDAGLSNGHKYWYKVNTQNEYGYSGNVTEVPATPVVPSSSGMSSTLLIAILVVVIVIVAVALYLVMRSRKKAAPAVPPQPAYPQPPPPAQQPAYDPNQYQQPPQSGYQYPPQQGQ